MGFEEILELQNGGLIPDHWMDMGVEREESEEIKEETNEEEKREQKPEPQVVEKQKKPTKAAIAQNPDLVKYSNKDNKAFGKKEANFKAAEQAMANMLDDAQKKGADAAEKAI